MSTGTDHLQLVHPAPTPPPDPLIGTTVDGRYKIDSVLGKGGMGVVYKATHVVLGKRLAIKVLKPDVSKEEEIIQRFRQEAQSASAIGSQHIIDISDFGNLPDGSTYFVMEFLDGSALTKVIETQRPITPERVGRIAKQLCEALGAAHERGIVHRDLKPDNIYLIERGADKDFVKVLDFGIAKVGGASSKLTRAGAVFGTPHYMSPEQCSGAPVDQRTDIYALGIILYEMASGRVPFDADNLMGILTKHIYEQPIPPHQLPPPVDVPAGLEAVILKCLAKSVDVRYQSMAEVKADLEMFEAGHTPNAVVEAAMRSTASGTMVLRDPTGRTALQVAVGAEAPAPQKRSPLLMIGIIVAALALLGAGGGGLYVFVLAPRGSSPPITVRELPTPEQPHIDTPPQTPQTPPPEQPQQPVAQQDPQPQQPAPPAQPAFIELTSNPNTVEVYQGDALLGNTPFRVERPASGQTVAISLRHPGFVPQPLVLSSMTQDHVLITMTPDHHPGGGGGGGHRPQPPVGPLAPQPPSQPPVQPPQPPPQQPRQPGGGGEVLDPWAAH